MAAHLSCLTPGTSNQQGVSIMPDDLTQIHAEESPTPSYSQSLTTKANKDPTYVCLESVLNNFLIQDICNNTLIKYFFKIALKESFTKPNLYSATYSIITVLENISRFFAKHGISYQASKIHRLLMADFSPR